MESTSIILMGSLAGTCLMATVAFGNPGLLPEHPNYPMKESKSPVTGQPTANDPGQELMYGQKAMNAATKKSNEGIVPTSRDNPGERNQSESQGQMGTQDQMGGEQKTEGREEMGGHQQMGSQGQKGGQPGMGSQGMSGQNQMGGQKSMGGHDQMGN